ncbi:cbb3-type cytochrome oxidase assembly protein CcoS [Idiomarina piscisalsi]|uniref:Cbb3-type cytochrome oxidase assembly protein CcoS n=1 Tax=Idiomarina piscisalsi TaxID=1096243 RepID=A0A432YWH7_9GAMM|nr:cbb3-type cytochrome oxidase assembly protein CcoS [Idiomarina piscisalsi]RUO67657.1 cbb3-type cytochrome oxidase assembly protein CcoS [Idiomarina piscisalsi]
MSVIYALIPVAIIFVIIAIAVFFWAVRSDQFEDIERQGLNILMDDDKPNSTDNKPPQDQADKEQESDNDAKR